MEYIKKFFQKEGDNIPEVHLNKHEPKYSYDPIKKKWVIEGEPEEEEKPNLPPPKIDSKKVKNEKDNKKNKRKNVKRYASVLNEDNIFHPTEENKIEDKKEEIISQTPIQKKVFKTNNKNAPFGENIKNNIVNSSNKNNNVEKNLNDIQILENENQIENEDEENNNLEDNNNNLEDNNNNLEEDKEIEKNDMKDLLSELSHREEPSFFPNDLTQIQEKNLEFEIEKLKNEYNEKIIKLKKNNKTEINKLKESVQFSEENYDESTNLLKKKIDNFINENLELKLNLDKINDELDYKKK